MISTGRRIRLLSEDIAIVHGSEEDEVEQSGRRLPVRYVYMDVVVKRNGRWQIVGSQLASPRTGSWRLTADSILPVRPNKIDDARHQHHPDHGVEFVEVLA